MRRSRRLSVAVGPSGSSQFAPKYKYSSSQSTRNSVRTLAGSPSSGLACRKPSWRGAACHASRSVRPSIWMAPPFRLAACATRARSVSGGNSLRGCASTGVAAASSSKVARIPPLTTAGRREHFSSGSGRCFRMPRGICGAVAEPVSHVRAAEPATPMLRQYHEAKAQARDALLFFRLGDFYELFYDDARIAAQILGITLTSRAKGEDRIPMAGVPHHAARAYVARLVAAGHKVAICDQMEVPGPGKQLVRREIVRLVTPRTRRGAGRGPALPRCGRGGAVAQAAPGGGDPGRLRAARRARDPGRLGSPLLSPGDAALPGPARGAHLRRAALEADVDRSRGGAEP